MPVVVYSPRYDISLCGLERLHPFDSCKYGRAWAVLRRTLGKRLAPLHRAVDRAATTEELMLVHSASYLESIAQPGPLSAALELPFLKRAPGWLLRWRILRPMRWATRGTLLAAVAALQHGVAVNLSGGYHHAQSDRGEGFCVYSDAALAVRHLRAEQRIRPGQRVAYVDLDAHQGNGVCHQFLDDRLVFILDMYNAAIYPRHDQRARARIDCDLPLGPGCRGDEYLAKLRQALPGFLDSISRGGEVALGVYNAGTDVFVGDQLGGLALTAEDVLQRDRFVVEQFRARGIPVVMLPSGGYSPQSYRLLAASVLDLLQRHAPRPDDHPAS